jgi:hypothetical protein
LIRLVGLLVIGSQSVLQDLGVRCIHLAHLLLQAELQVILGLLQLLHPLMLNLHRIHNTALDTVCKGGLACNLWAAKVM